MTAADLQYLRRSGPKCSLLSQAGNKSPLQCWQGKGVQIMIAVFVYLPKNSTKTIFFSALNAEV